MTVYSNIAEIYPPGPGGSQFTNEVVYILYYNKY